MVRRTLANELTTGKAAPQNIRSAAKKLDALRMYIRRQPDHPALAGELEDKVALSVRTEDPGITDQLLNGIKETLGRQTNTPSEEVVRSKLGLFFQGFKSGVAEFVLRVRPQDAEFVHSLCAQTDNPRTKSGDRESLLRQSRAGITPQQAPRQPAPEAPSTTTAPAAAAATNADPESDCTGEFGEEPSDFRKQTTVFPEFLLAPSATTGKPIATPAELAALTLGNYDRPPATGPQADPAGNPDTEQTYAGPSNVDPSKARPTNATHFDTARFETLNQGTPGDDGLSPSPTAPSGPAQPPEIQRPAQRQKDNRATFTADGHHRDPCRTGKPRDTQRPHATWPATDSDGTPAKPLRLQGHPNRHERESQILDLGRAERYFPDYMRQVILARDGGCIVPGCTVPHEHCEIHHLDPWENGGATRLEDGMPACSNHHHAVHAGLLTAVRNADGLPAVIRPKFMDSGQNPRRNAYWNPEPVFTMLPLF